MDKKLEAANDCRTSQKKMAMEFIHPDRYSLIDIPPLQARSPITPAPPPTRPQARAAPPDPARATRPTMLMPGDIQILERPERTAQRTAKKSENPARHINATTPLASYADTLKKGPLEANKADKKDDGFRVANRQGKATKDPNPLAKRTGVRVDERRIMITRDGKVAQTAGDLFLIANRMTAAINIALHQTEAPAHIRVQAVSVSRWGVLHTTADPEADAKMVLHFKEAILKAARTVDPGVCDMQENGEWLRFKLVRVPLEVYAGAGGLDLLARQLVAENPEMHLEIMRIGWLNSERTIQEGHESGRMKTATVVFAVRDRTTAAEIAKGAIRLGGKQTATTTFVEDLRTAQCETCCGWGHVGSHCHYNNGRRCGMCAGQHTTPEHRCNVTGCTAKKGKVCKHLIPKCANCNGEHFAFSPRCEHKQTTRRTTVDGDEVRPCRQ